MSDDQQIYDPNSRKIRTVRNLRRAFYEEGEHVLFDVVVASTGRTWPLFMSLEDFRTHNPDVPLAD